MKIFGQKTIKTVPTYAIKINIKEPELHNDRYYYNLFIEYDFKNYEYDKKDFLIMLNEIMSTNPSYIKPQLGSDLIQLAIDSNLISYVDGKFRIFFKQMTNFNFFNKKTQQNEIANFKVNCYYNNKKIIHKDIPVIDLLEDNLLTANFKVKYSSFVSPKTNENKEEYELLLNSINLIEYKEEEEFEKLFEDDNDNNNIDDKLFEDDIPF